ncbi:MAG: DUF2318 domain-containing protein [Clostridia bacterium]|nr:DUF2318 domain-containing protein [Clostridia bacterium]
MLAVLTGCSSNATETKAAATETKAIATQTSEGLSIDTSLLKSGITTISCKTDGTSMQLLAYKDDQDLTHISWNTCQSCNGSPMAYFDVEGEQLVCQNCGNQFEFDSIGTTSAGGCLPWAVADFTEDNGIITIPKVELEGMTDAFSNWKKGL